MVARVDGDPVSADARDVSGRCERVQVIDRDVTGGPGARNVELTLVRVSGNVVEAAFAAHLHRAQHLVGARLGAGLGKAGGGQQGGKSEREQCDALHGISESRQANYTQSGWFKV